MKRKEFLKTSGIIIGTSGIASAFGNSIDQVLGNQKNDKAPNLIIINLSGGIRNEDIFQSNSAMPKLLEKSLMIPNIQASSNDHATNLQELMFGGQMSAPQRSGSFFEHLHHLKKYKKEDCYSIYEILGNRYTSVVQEGKTTFFDTVFAFEIDSDDKIELKSQSYTEISKRQSIVSKFEKVETILAENSPKILTVNFSEMDVCHSNYSDYLDILTSIDLGIVKLTEKIKSLPFYKENTVIVVASSMGRNSKPNSIKDKNGKLGFDHNHETAKNTFAAIVNLSKLKISLNTYKLSYNLSCVNCMISNILNIKEQVWPDITNMPKVISPIVIES